MQERRSPLPAVTARQNAPRQVRSPQRGPAPRVSRLDQPRDYKYQTPPTSPKWRNWQTRRTQNPFPAMECRFNPDLRHQQKRSPILSVQRSALNEGWDSFGAVGGHVAAQSANRCHLAGMLTFIRRRRVGNHFELEFSYGDRTLIAHLAAKGPPAFPNQTIPARANDELVDWADEPENEIRLSGLQSALQ
jgi:hypothetical protein